MIIVEYFLTIIIYFILFFTKIRIIILHVKENSYLDRLTKEFLIELVMIYLIFYQ
jgi:hypothetical protein